MSQAVIIGGGPAGLTAGYELSKLGWGSTVLEADPIVGGISRTVNYNGYRFDIGGHRFFSKVPLINQLWKEMLGEEFLLRPRMSRIHYSGKFFDYPLKAANALAGLGPIEAMLIGLSYAKARAFPNKPETSFEHWVSNRFGHRLYNIFFKTYTEKVWGIPCNEISADWAAQRIKNLSLTEAVRNALLGAGKNKDGEVITTLIDQFHYPRLGPGMMWEHCERILTDRGNPTLRGVRAEKIRHRNGRVESVEARNANGERLEFGGEEFLSTMPLRELINCMDPLPPAEVLRAANGLRYRDYLTVVLIVKREHVFPDNWIYIHTPEVKMGRIQNYKNWSPYMVPDPSKSSLGLEYFLWDTDDLWSWSDERLIELGKKECVQIGLIEPDEVEDGTVVRMKKAYPVYDQEYPQHLASIQRYLETIDNLQTIGRNGQHRYNNQDHSMLTGVYAARNIVGEKYDIWSVNVDKEYHEEVREKDKSAQVGTKSGDRLIPTRITDEPTPEVRSLDELIAIAFARLDEVSLGVAVGLVAGLGMFLASAVLLLKGGTVVGPNLSLLGHFFIGYEVSWTGAFIGLIEAAIGGFILGYVGAWLRNSCIDGYAYFVKRSAEAKEQRDLLGKI
jgi:protoporphyrinogen oxidase